MEFKKEIYLDYVLLVKAGNCPVVMQALNADITKAKMLIVVHDTDDLSTLIE